MMVLTDFVIAHWKAYTKTNILHRDVSGGNILILPTFVQTAQGWFVKWLGVLADWEMSKPTLDKRQTSLPRQPERTVSGMFSRQYQSVDANDTAGYLAVHVRLRT